MDISSPAWAAAVKEPSEFTREQNKLGLYWTFLGLTTDVQNDGDWFRTSLGGRSIFVQRFGTELRAFENVCAHRFYPLRTEEKGHGPIRCGFHHWQYNKDGMAVGIPKCQEMFGVSPRELSAQLNRVDVATCGILVFGRFPQPGDHQSLEDYLGPGFAILEAMWSLDRAPYHIRTPIAANWKLCFHITLDDYHIVAVHPDTFGKNGYLPLEAVQYFRFGCHSAYFYGSEGDELTKMADQCRTGQYRPAEYRILQIFPNLLALQFEAAKTWYVLIQQYLPIAHDRCLSRSWYFRAPFPPSDANWIDYAVRRIAAPWAPHVIPFYIRKIFHEDNSICEGIQAIASQIPHFPILGRHEQRITWFEETYAQAMGFESEVFPASVGNA